VIELPLPDDLAAQLLEAVSGLVQPFPVLLFASCDVIFRILEHCALKRLQVKHGWMILQLVVTLNFYPFAPYGFESCVRALVAFTNSNVALRAATDAVGPLSRKRVSRHSTAKQ
jgi:hypothetical protein